LKAVEASFLHKSTKAIETLAYAPFLQTHAFFEASTWLVNSYPEPLLSD
jgi:hypothetical protein